jgi:hypothetical protein
VRDAHGGVVDRHAEVVHRLQGKKAVRFMVKPQLLKLSGWSLT